MTRRSNPCRCAVCGGKCPNQASDDPDREGSCIPCDENTYHAGLKARFPNKVARRKVKVR